MYAPAKPLQTVSVLGATGSIGQSTLDVLQRHSDLFDVYALSAHSSWQQLLQQCVQVKPQIAVMVNKQAAENLRQGLQEKGLNTQVLHGEKALETIASSKEVQTVMAAIVGAAGLPSTLAAAKAGKKLLLANKESLVMAGQLMLDAVAESGATLLPIDSEHNAIFQCMEKIADGETLQSLAVEKILLTGSGGPFRETSEPELKNVSPEMACAHPNWSMGRKISVDSATLMNKGLELIEACWLFNCQSDDIEVLIHKQSVIHSMVQFKDGSTLAQLGNPDMRTPIAHALAFPKRIDAGVKPLDFVSLARLDFEPANEQKFSALRLARTAWKMGKSAAIALNAANEIAVEAFLNHEIGFVDICHINEKVLHSAALVEPDSLQAVLNADAAARELAGCEVAKLAALKNNN